MGLHPLGSSGQKRNRCIAPWCLFPFERNEPIAALPALCCQQFVDADGSVEAGGPTDLSTIKSGALSVRDRVPLLPASRQATRCPAMRWMELPQSEFEALPHTLEQCVAAHLQHMASPASERLHLLSDHLIFGYMKWPNDTCGQLDWSAAVAAMRESPGVDFRILFRAFR